jgi:hypothetical protein
MRYDDVWRRVGLDTQRRVGEQAYFRGRRLLQFAIGSAMHIVLPHRQIALLRQRMRDRAGVGPAKRLEFVTGKTDDDFVLDRDDLKQIRSCPAVPKRLARRQP